MKKKCNFLRSKYRKQNRNYISVNQKIIKIERERYIETNENSLSF